MARIQLGAHLTELADDPSLPSDVRAEVVLLGPRLPGVTGSSGAGGADSVSAAQAYVAAEVLLSGGSALGLRRPEGWSPLDSRDAWFTRHLNRSFGWDAGNGEGWTRAKREHRRVLLEHG